MSESEPDPGQNSTTRLETFDVLIWDESHDHAEYREWSTYARYVHHFEHSAVRESSLWINSSRFSELLRLGWQPMSMSIRRYGFLWLKETRVWTFNKRVEWDREGTVTSFVGSRVTPAMPRNDSDDPNEWDPYA
jgi:hypothetical protein